MYEAKKIVNELREADIKYIAHYKWAKPAVYGRNAQN
jgi:hypothetical protein